MEKYSAKVMQAVPISESVEGVEPKDLVFTDSSEMEAVTCPDPFESFLRAQGGDHHSHPPPQKRRRCRSVSKYHHSYHVCVATFNKPGCKCTDTVLIFLGQVTEARAELPEPFNLKSDVTLPQIDIDLTVKAERNPFSPSRTAISDDDDFNIPSPLIQDINMSDDDGGAFSFSPDFNADSHPKLYPNASITTLQAVCMLVSWFTSFPGMSKSSFSRLLRILHEFLLPNGNNLPTNYSKALSLIQPFLSPVKEYHCCVNDCIIFRNSTTGKYEKLTKCPECDKDRFEPESTVPRKQFKYLPLETRLQRFFGNPETSKLLQSHYNFDSKHTVISSIHESEAWKSWFGSNGIFEGDCRAMSFAICMDGLNPFAQEKCVYSMWPIFLVPLNLPHHLRMKSSSMMLMGLIPGPQEPKNTDPYIDILVDDILHLNQLTMHDAYKDEKFQLKANILLHIFDYPGQNKILHCQGISPIKHILLVHPYVPN